MKQRHPADIPLTEAEYQRAMRILRGLPDDELPEVLAQAKARTRAKLEAARC